MTAITYGNVTQKLFEAVPELHASYEDARVTMGPPNLSLSPYWIYGRPLGAYVTQLLTSDEDDGRLSHVFGFLEQLANHQEAPVRELVAFPFCYQLARDPSVLRAARRHMGQATLRLSHEMEIQAQLGDRLIEAVPQLRRAYEAELAAWRDELPGPIILYENVLIPYLISLLEAGGNEEQLRCIFAFLEELASHESERVQAVVAIAVCDSLDPHAPWLPQALDYMGPKTRHLMLQRSPLPKGVVAMSNVLTKAVQQLKSKRRMNRLPRRGRNPTQD